MTRPTSIGILTAILAVLSLCSLSVVHLALTDIAHGEENPAAEWLAVRIGLALVLLCQLSLLGAGVLSVKRDRHTGSS